MPLPADRPLLTRGRYVLPLKEKDTMAEFRANMFNNPEVKRVLKEQSEPLHKQFIAIAKRKTKILDPSKKPTGNGNRPDPVEEPLLTVEDFAKDLDKAKMFVDLKEIVPDPIKGNPDVVCEIEFSRLDAERGFIESQVRHLVAISPSFHERRPPSHACDHLPNLSQPLSGSGDGDARDAHRRQWPHGPIFDPRL